MKKNKPMDWLSFENRKVIATVIIVAITFFLPRSFWIILPAYLMLQTSKGTALRQDLFIFSLLVVSLLIAAFINYFLATILALGLLSILTVGLLQTTYLNLDERLTIIWVPILVLIAALDPSNIVPDKRLGYCLIGAFVGLVCNTLIAYVNFEKEFRKDLIATLQSLYFFAKRLRISAEFDNAYQERIKLEETFSKANYPNWVFELGFNAILRGGYRFVLLQLDHIIAAMTSLSFNATKLVDADQLQKLREPLNEVLNKNAELIVILNQYAEAKKLPSDIGDVSEDVARLENIARQILPDHPELIDLKETFTIIASIVRDVTDIRKLLLTLIAALPTS